MNPTDLYYITSDLGSPHTLKRISFLERHFKVYLLGRSNPKNIFAKKEIKIFVWFPFLRQILRVLSSLSLINEIMKIDKNQLIVIRGVEYEILCFILRKNYIIEITDIHSKYFKNRIVKFIFNKLYRSSSKILLTSPGFEIPLGKNNSLIWHNVPNFSLKKYRDISGRKRSIVYCGYLRSHDSINTISKYFNIDLYGKFNQPSSPKHSFNLGDSKMSYLGEYPFSEVQQIYENYLFSYVQDHYGENSDYNITNRLYESCFSGCIPIAIDNGSFISEFMKSNKIGIIIRKYKELELLSNLSPNDLNIISKRSQKMLNSLIKFDHKNLTNTLRNKI